MPCTNPNVKGLCQPAMDTYKRICKNRCKWYKPSLDVPAEEQAPSPSPMTSEELPPDLTS